MTRVVVHPRRRASGYDAVVTIDPAPRAGRQDLAATAIARARLAGDDDNAAILELMADVPMEGNLALATQRGPDFFALYRLQRGQHFLFVDEAKDNSGRLAGMGGILVRSGWLDGVTMPVGYLGDLRTRGFVRERVAFPQVYAHFFHQTAQQTGCDHYLTAILADNAAAARASVRSEIADEVGDYAETGVSTATAMAEVFGELPELRDAMSLVWRILILWLAIIALFVIAGWVS